jgi:hypothetical protein
MPLQTQKLGQALGESLTLHSTLCRREAGAFQKAIQSGQEVVVACTQEKKLFTELATQTEGATSPIKFVNIREMGGWSSDAQNASPKLAALLAAAHLPEPDPVPGVPFKSEGRLLIIGPLDKAEKAAVRLITTAGQNLSLTSGTTPQANISTNAHYSVGFKNSTSPWGGEVRVKLKTSLGTETLILPVS